MLDFASIEEAFPNDDKKKRTNKKNISNDCQPLQPPNYEIPICENKEIVKNVMETSLNPPPKNDFKKDGIKAFDFDEYDAYLSINDIKTNNQDSSLEYRTTPFLADYLKSLRNDFPANPSKIEQFTNMNTNIKIDVNLYNLFLFIFLGIIIIILIHQITSLVKE
jgi:ABC-type lipoprotein release transport system permease subunit